VLQSLHKCPVPASICNYSTTNKTVLIQHVEMYHSHAFIDENTCPCDNCDTIVTSPRPKRRLDDLEVASFKFLNNLENKLKVKNMDKCDCCDTEKTPKLQTPPAQRQLKRKINVKEYLAVTKFYQTMAEKPKLPPKEMKIDVTTVTVVTPYDKTAISPVSLGTNVTLVTAALACYNTPAVSPVSPGTYVTAVTLKLPSMNQNVTPVTATLADYQKTNFSPGTDVTTESNVTLVTDSIPAHIVNKLENSAWQASQDVTPVTDDSGHHSSHCRPDDYPGANYVTPVTYPNPESYLRQWRPWPYQYGKNKYSVVTPGPVTNVTPNQNIDNLKVNENSENCDPCDILVTSPVKKKPKIWRQWD
jgi:hypothetical protein